MVALLLVQQIQKIGAGPTVLMLPCDHGGIWPDYFQCERVTHHGEHYFRFIRAAATTPELVVRRLTGVIIFNSPLL